MGQVKIAVTGTMPLLMHSQEGMNRLNPLARELTILNKKRPKTDEDVDRISDLEMELGLYWSKKMDAAMWPAWNFLRSVQDGAKGLKLGTKTIQNLKVFPGKTECRLIYPGHEGMTRTALVANREFRDTRTVVVSGTVWRTRPIFNEWSFDAIYTLLPGMDVEELQRSATRGGELFGIGDFRVGTKKGGQYGTYTAVVTAL